jgi:hypothetical protein
MQQAADDFRAAMAMSPYMRGLIKAEDARR